MIELPSATQTPSLPVQPQDKMPSLGSLKKHELVAAMVALGEEPPREWKVMELRKRLEELEIEKGVTRTTHRVKTSLQELMHRLHAAAKKKTTLVTFLQEELHMTLSGTETMAVMVKKGMDEVYTQSELHHSDPIGFGEHSAKSYLQAMEEVPEYCKWAQTMAQEGSVSIRLERFVRWLNQQSESDDKTGSTRPPAKAMPKAVKGSKGYTRGRSSPGSGKSSTEDTLQATLAQMVEAMNVMQGEIDQLREERPHKRSETSSMAESFEKVADARMEQD